MGAEQRNSRGSKKLLKQTYQTPALIKYGTVRQLTRDGAGSDTTDGNNAACTVGGTKTCMVASDISLKQNFVRIGDHPLGIGLHLFDYKPEYQEAFGYGRQFGVIAQEVQEVMPEAVVEHPEGYLMVDLEMLGVESTVH